MASKSLSIGSLLLDTENPRITRAGSQRDALQRIIDDQDVRLAVLAENIVKQNSLNPMDRWLVLRADNSKFIVYEGNRRLAALKILSNPTVLGSLEVKAPLRRRLEKAAQKFDAQSFGKIDCFVIASRAEGAQWLHQRHTGENKGSGIVSWNGLATARFRGSDPALQALNAVAKFGNLSVEEVADLEDGFPITTLDRLLSSTAVRRLIGFDIRQSRLLTNLPPQNAIRILTRIVRDLSAQSITVSDVKNQKLQIDYIRALGSDLPDLSLGTGTLEPVDDWTEATFNSEGSTPHEPADQSSAKPTPSAGAATSPTRTRSAKPYERKFLIERDCVLNVTNPKIKEIERELRSLRLSEHRHAISVLFRVFLEISVDVYLVAKGIPTKTTVNSRTVDKKLNAKVKDAIADMVQNGVDPKHLQGVSKGIDDKNSPIHIDTLHGYVHNQFYSPKESDLSVAFDNAKPFIEEIWK